MPFPVAVRFSWINTPPSVVTDAVSSVVTRGVEVAHVTGPIEGPTTAGKDDAHPSGLEEVLIGHSTNSLAKQFERSLRGSTSR